MRLYRFEDWRNRVATLKERKPFEPLFEKSLEEIQADWNIIDAGAGVGEYAIPIALRTKGQILAVECHPDMGRVLHKNISLFRLSNVKVCSCALMDKPGMVSIKEDYRSAGGTFVERARRELAS